MHNFFVFGRKVFDQPLARVDQIQAIDLSGAREAALKQYDEKEWVEMIVIPAAEILHVVQGGKKK